MRRASHRLTGRRQPLVAALLLAGAAACAGAQAHAQTAEKRLHFIDSSSERTPAKTAFPIYPRIARRDRIEGDATVCFKIDMRGKIRSVKVKNYTHRIFRRPAIRAIKASSFEPVQPNEILSLGRTCRTYRFRLEPLLVDTDADKPG